MCGSETHRQAEAFSAAGVHLPSRARPFIWARWQERLLAGGGVGVLALPRASAACLQRAAVGERHLPRVRPELVDRVEVGGRLLVALAARQEHDPGHGRGHDLAEARDRRLARPLPATTCRPTNFLPGITMLGLSSMPSSSTRCAISVSNTVCSVAVVTVEHCSIEWSPSISTSGSTIGTMPSSWHSAA